MNCQEPGCDQPRLNTTGGLSPYCSQHISRGVQIQNVPMCAHQGCNQQATLTMDGLVSYCPSHFQMYCMTMEPFGHASANHNLPAGVDSTPGQTDNMNTWLPTHLMPEAQLGMGGFNPNEGQVTYTTPQDIPRGNPGETAPSSPPKILYGPQPKCQHHGCRRLAMEDTNGNLQFCKSHMPEHGLTAREGRRRRVCAIDGCTREARVSVTGERLYCGVHMIDFGLTPRPGHHKVCTMEGCKALARRDNSGVIAFCTAHMGSQNRIPIQLVCKHPGCGGKSITSENRQRMYCADHMGLYGLSPLPRGGGRSTTTRLTPTASTGMDNSSQGGASLGGSHSELPMLKRPRLAEPPHGMLTGPVPGLLFGMGLPVKAGGTTIPDASHMLLGDPSMYASLPTELLSRGPTMMQVNSLMAHVAGASGQGAQVFPRPVAAMMPAGWPRGNNLGWFHGGASGAAGASGILPAGVHGANMGTMQANIMHAGLLSNSVMPGSSPQGNMMTSLPVVNMSQGWNTVESVPTSSSVPLSFNTSQANPSTVAVTVVHDVGAVNPSGLKVDPDTFLYATPPAMRDPSQGQGVSEQGLMEVLVHSGEEHKVEDNTVQDTGVLVDDMGHLNHNGGGEVEREPAGDMGTSSVMGDVAVVSHSHQDPAGDITLSMPGGDESAP